MRDVVTLFITLELVKYILAELVCRYLEERFCCYIHSRSCIYFLLCITVRIIENQNDLQFTLRASSLSIPVYLSYNASEMSEKQSFILCSCEDETAIRKFYYRIHLTLFLV